MAMTILEAARRNEPAVEVSLDLNLSCTRVPIDRNRLILDKKTALDLPQLSIVAESSPKIFLFKDKVLHPLEVRARGI